MIKHKVDVIIEALRFRDVFKWFILKCVKRHSSKYHLLFSCKSAHIKQMFSIFFLGVDVIDITLNSRPHGDTVLKKEKTTKTRDLGCGIPQLIASQYDTQRSKRDNDLNNIPQGFSFQCRQSFFSTGECVIFSKRHYTQFRAKLPLYPKSNIKNLYLVRFFSFL